MPVHIKQLLTLFTSFFKIGLFTFGGGYAMIPLIELEVIDKRGWLDRTEFLDLLTLAQSVPGPIAINTSVFVGYQRCGFRGALAALAGTALPSFVVILLIAMVFTDIRYNPVVDAAFKGMRPAVVALILVPVFSLAHGMHRAMLVVIAAVALAIWWFGFSPIWLLIAGALCGIAWSVWLSKKVRP